MRKVLLIVALFVSLVFPALATTQEMSLFVFEGQRLWTYDMPRLDQAFPDVTFPKFTWISTANYKGYRATWATFQKRLYLVGLEARVKGHDHLLRNEQIVPKNTFPLKVTEWSGKIVHAEKSFSIEGEELKSWENTVTTTFTVQKGLVISVDVEVDRKPAREDGEQAEPIVPSEAAPSASSDAR